MAFKYFALFNCSGFQKLSSLLYAQKFKFNIKVIVMQNGREPLERYGVLHR